MQNVIGIKTVNIRALRMQKPHIARAAGPQVFLLIGICAVQKLDARVASLQQFYVCTRVIGRCIVNAQHFKIGVALRLNACKTFTQVGHGVVERNDDAHKRF